MRVLALDTASTQMVLALADFGEADASLRWLPRVRSMRRARQTRCCSRRLRGCLPMQGSR